MSDKSPSTVKDGQKKASSSPTPLKTSSPTEGDPSAETRGENAASTAKQDSPTDDATKSGQQTAQGLSRNEANEAPLGPGAIRWVRSGGNFYTRFPLDERQTEAQSYTLYGKNSFKFQEAWYTLRETPGVPAWMQTDVAEEMVKHLVTVNPTALRSGMTAQEIMDIPYLKNLDPDFQLPANHPYAGRNRNIQKKPATGLTAPEQSYITVQDADPGLVRHQPRSSGGAWTGHLLDQTRRSNTLSAAPGPSQPGNTSGRGGGQLHELANAAEAVSSKNKEPKEEDAAQAESGGTRVTSPPSKKDAKQTGNDDVAEEEQQEESESSSELSEEKDDVQGRVDKQTPTTNQPVGYGVLDRVIRATTSFDSRSASPIGTQSEITPYQQSILPGIDISSKLLEVADGRNAASTDFAFSASTFNTPAQHDTPLYGVASRTQSIESEGANNLLTTGPNSTMFPHPDIHQFSFPTYVTSNPPTSTDTQTSDLVDCISTFGSFTNGSPQLSILSSTMMPPDLSRRADGLDYHFDGVPNLGMPFNELLPQTSLFSDNGHSLKADPLVSQQQEAHNNVGAEDNLIDTNTWDPEVFLPAETMTEDPRELFQISGPSNVASEFPIGGNLFPRNEYSLDSINFTPQRLQVPGGQGNSGPLFDDPHLFNTSTTETTLEDQQTFNDAFLLNNDILPTESADFQRAGEVPIQDVHWEEDTRWSKNTAPGFGSYLDGDNKTGALQELEVSMDGKRFINHRQTDVANSIDSGEKCYTLPNTEAVLHGLKDLPSEALNLNVAAGVRVEPNNLPGTKGLSGEHAGTIDAALEPSFSAGFANVNVGVSNFPNTKTKNKYNGTLDAASDLYSPAGPSLQPDLTSIERMAPRRPDAPDTAPSFDHPVEIDRPSNLPGLDVPPTLFEAQDKIWNSHNGKHRTRGLGQNSFGGNAVQPVLSQSAGTHYAPIDLTNDKDASSTDNVDVAIGAVLNTSVEPSLAPVASTIDLTNDDKTVIVDSANTAESIPQSSSGRSSSISLVPTPAGRPKKRSMEPSYFHQEFAVEEEPPQKKMKGAGHTSASDRGTQNLKQLAPESDAKDRAERVTLSEKKAYGAGKRSKWNSDMKVKRNEYYAPGNRSNIRRMQEASRMAMGSTYRKPFAGFGVESPNAQHKMEQSRLSEAQIKQAERAVVKSGEVSANMMSWLNGQWQTALDAEELTEAIRRLMEFNQRRQLDQGAQVDLEDPRERLFALRAKKSRPELVFDLLRETNEDFSNGYRRDIYEQMSIEDREAAMRLRACRGLLRTDNLSEEDIREAEVELERSRAVAARPDWTGPPHDYAEQQRKARAQRLEEMINSNPEPEENKVVGTDQGQEKTKKGDTLKRKRATDNSAPKPKRARKGGPKLTEAETSEIVKGMLKETGGHDQACSDDDLAAEFERDLENMMGWTQESADRDADGEKNQQQQKSATNNAEAEKFEELQKPTEYDAEWWMNEEPEEPEYGELIIDMNPPTKSVTANRVDEASSLQDLEDAIATAPQKTQDPSFGKGGENAITSGASRGRGRGCGRGRGRGGDARGKVSNRGSTRSRAGRKKPQKTNLMDNALGVQKEPKITKRRGQGQKRGDTGRSKRGAATKSISGKEACVETEKQLAMPCGTAIEGSSSPAVTSPDTTFVDESTPNTSLLDQLTPDTTFTSDFPVLIPHVQQPSPSDSEISDEDEEYLPQKHAPALQPQQEAGQVLGESRSSPQEEAPEIRKAKYRQAMRSAELDAEEEREEREMLWKQRELEERRAVEQERREKARLEREERERREKEQQDKQRREQHQGDIGSLFGDDDGDMDSLFGGDD